MTGEKAETTHSIQQAKRQVHEHLKEPHRQCVCQEGHWPHLVGALPHFMDKKMEDMLHD